MKLIFVTCLVVTAFAAPADKTKRNILPGDSRYDAQHHGTVEDFRRHENEVDIAKALGGYTGSFSIPETFYQFPGYETGIPFGSTDFLNRNGDASKTNIDSTVVKIGDTKTTDQPTTVTENGSTSATVEPVSTDKPSVAPTSDESSIELLNRAKTSDADQESTKNSEESKAATESGSDESSSDDSKTTVKPATANSESSAKGISSNAGLITSRLATPFESSFGSSLGRLDVSSTAIPYGSDFDLFQQSGYKPSFQSSESYTPSFDSFNPNYQLYSNNFGGYPLGLDTYSVDYSRRVPYISPQSFEFQNSYSIPAVVNPTSFSSIVSSVPSEFKFSPQESYFSPSFGQIDQQFLGSVVSQDQLLKKYETPISVAQPTTAPFQDDVKIKKASYSGVSQLTDENGGYVY